MSTERAKSRRSVKKPKRLSTEDEEFYLVQFTEDNILQICTKEEVQYTATGQFQAYYSPKFWNAVLIMRTMDKESLEKMKLAREKEMRAAVVKIAVERQPSRREVVSNNLNKELEDSSDDSSDEETTYQAPSTSTPKSKTTKLPLKAAPQLAAGPKAAQSTGSVPSHPFPQNTSTNIIGATQSTCTKKATLSTTPQAVLHSTGGSSTQASSSEVLRDALGVLNDVDTPNVSAVLAPSDIDEGVSSMWENSMNSKEDLHMEIHNLRQEVKMLRKDKLRLQECIDEEQNEKFTLLAKIGYLDQQLLEAAAIRQREFNKENAKQHEDTISPPDAGLVPHDIAKKFQMVELTPGSGVYLYGAQVDIAYKRKSATALARYLLSCFYDPAELTRLASLTKVPKAIVNAIVAYTIRAFKGKAAEVSETAIRKSLRSKVSGAVNYGKRKMTAVQE